MKADQGSKTADAAAAARAGHFLHGGAALFADPYAVELTSAPWRVICRSRVLHRVVERKLFAPFRPVQWEILSRARYAEEKLEEALTEGVGQYVLIGAGLDSFVWRRPDLADRLTVFELDHPATQTVKRRRLARAGLTIPGNARLVAVDFETESIVDALARTSYAREARAFFSWMGVVPYLSEEAVYATLTALVRFVAVGSQVVFDYRAPDDLLESRDLELITKLRRFTERRGEALKSTFHPNAFARSLSNLGYRVLENLSPEQIGIRHRSLTSGRFEALPGSYYMHLQVAPR